MTNVKPAGKTAQKKDTTTAKPLTHPRAKELLDEKNAKYGEDKYTLGGIVTGVGKRAYVYARRANRATPTIFWADGDVLRPCTRKTHADQRRRVRASLVEAGEWLK
jgi:hypothetical protein